MRIGNMLYRGAVSAREFFERVRIGWAVSLAKLAVSAVSRVAKGP
jgi:hypothetical protein